MVKWRSGPWVAKNQCWIGVSGAGPAASARSSSAAPGALRGVTAVASSAMVWCRKTSREVSASPARRARETIWMLRIESPPSSKKLSLIPTVRAPSTSVQIRASSRSVSVRGAVAVPSGRSASSRGAGSARRSSLPLELSGMASRATNAPGTIWPGRVRPRAARSSAEAGGSPPGAGT
ncbi:hypothetical protein SANTM175S_10262 [Streptomyces antimycoticus]